MQKGKHLHIQAFMQDGTKDLELVRMWYKAGKPVPKVSPNRSPEATPAENPTIRRPTGASIPEVSFIFMNEMHMQ